MPKLEEWSPDSWTTGPPFRTRVLRAVTAPAAAAGLVLTVVVLVAIVSVLATPRDPLNNVSGSEVDSTQMTDFAVTQGSAGDESAHSSTVHETPTRVIVHVAGAVEQPGMIELDSGARVADAIEAAGGASEEAQLAQINLARVVNDGEQILVPHADDVNVAPLGDGLAGLSGGLVNINRADESALETLPGIGPALAGRIVNWREQYGPFTTVDDLLQVSGIGPKVFIELRDAVTVG